MTVGHERNDLSTGGDWSPPEVSRDVLDDGYPALTPELADRLRRLLGLDRRPTSETTPA
jgi:hypothetical protein